MITKYKVKRLEDNYNKATRSGKHAFLLRHVLLDGSYIDQEGRKLSNLEVIQIEKENRELKRQEGTVVKVTHFR